MVRMGVSLFEPCSAVGADLWSLGVGPSGTLTGHWCRMTVLLKMLLNYLTPFVVANFGLLLSKR